LGIPAAAPVVTMVGRVTAIKEPLDFVRVAILVRKRIPEAVFLLAGGGELLSRVREECDRANLGEGLRLLGWREDLPELLAGTDLAVLTSRSEGTPVALIEAAAAGVPAVATRVGGVPSVVRDGITGVLVPPSDPERMAAEVVRLLEDRERRRAMGEAARDHVLSRFGVARLVENLSNLYESTAQGR
jgi:glycosyltransferase involved in cell wall biosynthesis